MKENKNFKLKSICHCERSEAISQKIATPYGLAMTESGRSMVEMLGVLAVIGVLSVAGVGGYTAAMKRHRANELLNEASKRAAIVAMQLASGKTAPTNPDNTLIAEFTDPTNHTFKVGKANDKQFNIEITGVSESVCQQMKNAKGGVIKDFKPDTCVDNATVILTFNNDMSTGDLVDEDIDPACEGVECPAGTTCGVAGNCVAPAASNGCSKNSDCNDWCASNKGANDYGCYCKISANYTGTENACYNNFSGTCATISNTEKTNKYSSRSNLTWWSAQNFCKAINRPMASKQSACNGSNSGCTSTPSYYWLPDCYGTDCTDHSCSTFIGNYGRVEAPFRRRDFNYALCE